MVNEALDKPSGILLGKRAARPEAISFETLVPAFNFPVALRVIRGGFDVGQPGQADKLLKVFSNKLRTISVMIRGEVSGYFSRARCKIISTSSSVIAVRNSQCSRKLRTTIQNRAKIEEGAGDV
jgi:hypothetical protein